MGGVFTNCALCQKEIEAPDDWYTNRGNWPYATTFLICEECAAEERQRKANLDPCEKCEHRKSV